MSNYCNLIVIAILLCSFRIAVQGDCPRVIDKYPDTIRSSAITHLFESYIEQHNATALRLEAEQNPTQFCLRKFVSTKPFGCNNLGNNQFDFMGGFAAAIILNRTFIQNGLHCGDHMFFQPWIMSGENILALLKAKCPSVTIGDAEMILIKQGKNPRAYSDFRCKADEFQDLSLNFWNAELFSWWLFNKYSGATLGPSARERADILMSHPVYMMSQFEMTGYAFRYGFDFSDQVKSLCQSVLKSLISPSTCKYLDDLIVIGVHMRHLVVSFTTDTTEVDHTFEDSVSSLLTSIDPTRQKKCALLVASDRNSSIAQLTQWASSRNCDVIVVPKPEVDVNKYMAACGGDILCMEQGAFARGIVQLADIYLLGHAQYFVGTTSSTFSRLIGNRVAVSNTYNGDRYLMNTLSPIRYNVPNAIEFHELKNYGFYVCPTA
jgi:hypothetical protein